MKIIAFETWGEEFPLTRPYSIAFRETSGVKNFFVKLKTDQGHIGLGCAAPEPHVTGESEETCEQKLNGINLSGISLDDFKSLREKLPTLLMRAPAARAAVDMALWDLEAQNQGIPLAELWGLCHKKLPTSITIGIKSIEETCTEADEYLGRGFRVIKLKLGRGLEEDIARTIKLREAVGADVGIRVDMNQAYSLRDYQAYLKSCEQAKLEFCEQPLPADQWEQIEGLSDAEKSMTCFDESIHSPEDASRLVSKATAGIFNIKLMKCGGPTEARAIADIAERSGIHLMWGCMDESRISIAAALHTALCCPSTRYLDLDGSLDLARDLVTGGFHLEQGEMRITEASGLGVKLI